MQWRARTTELTERLKKYKLLLPEKLLQRGLSNLGELTRLEIALQRLVKGDDKSCANLLLPSSILWHLQCSVQPTRPI